MGREAQIPTTFPPLARNRYSYTRFEEDSWIPTGLTGFLSPLIGKDPPFFGSTLPSIRFVFPITTKRISSQVLIFIYGIRIDDDPVYLIVVAFKNNSVSKSEMM